MSRSLPCLGVAAAALSLLLGGCQEGGRTLRAFQAESLNELIGGPGAVGQTGDFVLENDRIRAVVLGPHERDHSAGPGLFGGSLADLDLRRQEHRFHGGKGLDSFAEMIPMVNLLFPEPQPPDLDVSVVSDGSDGEEARVRSRGRTAFIFEALRLFLAPPNRGGIGAGFFPGLHIDVCFSTDYVVRPGSPVVEVTTTAAVRPAGEIRSADSPDICEEDLSSEEPTPLPPVLPTDPDTALFQALLGDSPLTVGPDDPLVYWPGIIAGDFVYFGHTSSAFAPGMGYDKQTVFQRLLDAGENTFTKPLRFPAVMATGDRVSYAMAASGGGELLVPIFLSSATAMLSSIHRCQRAEDDDADCDQVRRWSYTRYLAVGEGDAASAAAPLHRLLGSTMGRLEGTVVDSRTGKPVPHAQVFLLERPSLARETPGLDRALRTGELPYDILADFLREKEDNVGKAVGVLTQIRADRGTDPILDGHYEADLPAGRYVAVAYAPGRAPPGTRRRSSRLPSPRPAAWSTWSWTRAAARCRRS